MDVAFVVGPGLEEGDAALGFFAELNDFLDFGNGGDFRGEGGEGESEGPVGVFAEDDLEEFANAVDAVAGHSGAAESDGVELRDGVGFHSGEEGRKIHGHAARIGKHGEAADAAELVDRDVGADDGARGDVHVAAEDGAVDHGDVVGDGAVVADVGVDHEIAAGAEDGFAVEAGGAVDGDAFAEDVVIADEDFGMLAAEFAVLGEAAEDGCCVHDVAFAHGERAEEACAAVDDGACANGDGAFDHGVCAHGHVGRELGFFGNNGGGMNCGNGDTSGQLLTTRSIIG
jgi:hypothetical protein